MSSHLAEVPAAHPSLESFPTDNLPETLGLEVQQFIDSQETAHPFQFPQFAIPGSRLVLLRQRGKICWAGTFELHLPLGQKAPWIRALVATGGPVCDDLQTWETATEELVATMNRERFAFLEVSPDWATIPADDRVRQLKNAPWKNMGDERVSLRLDLTPSEGELFARFRKITRYEIRRAERVGVVVSEASNEEETGIFLDLYKSLAIRKRFRAESLQRLRKIIAWLMSAPGRGTLLLARTHNGIRGGAVIGAFGRRCWYLWGANEKQEHLSVGHILQWRALQWAKSHGCAEYDFGGYVPGATSGPAWFKAGFGGSVIYSGTSYRRVTHSNRYRFYSTVLKIRS